MALRISRCFIIVLAMLAVSSGTSPSEKSKDIAIFYAGKNTLTQLIVLGLSESNDSLYESSSLVASKVDCGNYKLLLAIGNDAIKSVVENCNGHNILAIETAANIKKSGYDKIPRVGFLYIDQRPQKVVGEVVENFESIRKIGILVGSEEEKNEYEKILINVNAIIAYEVVMANDDLGPSFMSLIKNVDAVLITSNEDIWQPYKIKAFLLTGIRNGKVLIGGVNPQFVTAGVFAGSYTDLKQLGIDIGNSVRRNGRVDFNGYYENSNFMFNKIIARRLGLRPAKSKE